MWGFSNYWWAIVVLWFGSGLGLVRAQLPDVQYEHPPLVPNWLEKVQCLWSIRSSVRLKGFSLSFMWGLITCRQAVVFPAGAITASVDVTNGLPKEAVIFMCTSLCGSRWTILGQLMREWDCSDLDVRIVQLICPNALLEIRGSGPDYLVYPMVQVSPVVELLCMWRLSSLWPTTKSALIIVISPVKLTFWLVCALSAT